MQAIVLVGGEGTRLRPLTYGTPKPMVPILGVPFLERTLARLAAADVREVVFAAGYLPAAIRDHFGDGSRFGMNLTYVVEDLPLGTAGALRNVADHVRGTFFVLNGDILTSLNLHAMLAYHREKGGLGVLHLIQVEDPSAFGCVVHGDDGRISRFVEKPPRDQAPTNAVNAGTYLLERSVLDRIPVGRPVSIERETFPELLADGAPLYAHTTSDYWLDLGRPEAYLRAHRDILVGDLVLDPLLDPARHPGHHIGPADPDAPIFARDPVFLGADVLVDGTAVVGPYAVLGEGTRLESGAIVRNSVLWDGVVVGAGAIVDGAILASRVRVGDGAIVEPGSVIGHDEIIAPGVVVPREARIPAHSSAG